MARITKYTIDGTITDSDKLLGTDAESANATKNYLVGDLADYITSDWVAVGSGTTNYIPLWTPDGNTIGDSIMFQSASSPLSVQVGTNAGSGQQTVLGAGYITTSGIGADQGTFTSITSGNAGVVTILGNAIIGDAATDILQISSSVSDYTGTASTAAGQVLVSTANGQLVWAPAPSVGNVVSDPAAAVTINSIPLWIGSNPATLSSNSPITTVGGAVGIGTSGTNPQDKLHVQGTVRAVVAGSSGAAFNAINAFGVSSTFRFENNHAVLALKNNSNVVATKISSDGFSWFDGGSVGIGTKTPAAPIEMVVNDASGKGLLLSNVGDNTAYDSIRVTYSGYGTGSPECIFKPKTQPGSGIVNTYFRFKTNGGELAGNKANVTVDGKVGIGTTNDVIASRLTVAKGDIEVTEYQKGLILRSTNGTRYRLVVADDGTLTTTAV